MNRCSKRGRSSLDTISTLNNIEAAARRRPGDPAVYDDWIAMLTVLRGERPDLLRQYTQKLRMILEARIRERRDSGETLGALFRSDRASWILTAPYHFEDYLIALEWDRVPEQRFYLPRRKALRPVVQDLQDLKDDRLDELLLSEPPRIGKTTLLMMFVTYLIGCDPEASNLYSAYSDTITMSFYNGVLEVLKDPFTYLWHEIFPGLQIAETNAKDECLSIGRKKRYKSLTCRSLYGTLNGACDCSGFLISDDLISGIEEAMSKDRLANAGLKVQNNLLTRAKEGAKILWCGTRWSLYDPIGNRLEMLESEERLRSRRYRNRCVPALDEVTDESNFQYDYGVGFSTEYYRNRRAEFERNNDMASWLAQYQGQPIERDGAVFSPDDFRYFNGQMPEGDPDRVFMAVDPAWGGGDYVAAPVCVQFGDDIYIPDVVYDNGDKKVTQPLIVDTIVKWNVQACNVEATKMTMEYRDGIDKMLRQKGKIINLLGSIKHYTGTGKQQRIFDKAPEIRERMVFLDAAKRSPAYSRFMQNVFSFKVIGKNKNDDAPDSLAQAIEMTFHSQRSITLKKRTFI